MLSKVVQAWNRRSLPTSVMAMRMAKCHYSQYGEDAVVEAIVRSRDRKGFFVDVGCFEPVSLSNTYMLYRQGWSGIAIDPNRDMAALWKKHRSRDRFVCCAVGEVPGTIQYAKNVALPNESRVITGHESSSETTISVPMRRLDEILATELKPGTQIDVMSVDCEGLDLSVLKSNDFLRFRPTVLIVEDEDKGSSEIAHYVEGLGYGLTGMTLKSRIYSLTD